MAQQFKTQNSKLKIQNCAMAQQFKTQNSKFKKNALNGKEGALSSRRRGPEHGRLRQITNMDAETTSCPAPLETKGHNNKKDINKK